MSGIYLKNIMSLHILHHKLMSLFNKNQAQEHMRTLPNICKICSVRRRDKVCALSLTVNMLSNVMFTLKTLQRAGCWDWWNLQKNMGEFQIKVLIDQKLVCVQNQRIEFCIERLCLFERLCRFAIYHLNLQQMQATV